MPQKIQLEQISLAADRPLVSDVSFTLRRGQVLALLGSSGCGKSLTCAAALGLLPPGVRQTAGRVLLDGIPVHGEQLRGATIATIMQNPRSAFNPLQTMAAHARETCRAAGRETNDAVLLAAMEEVGLDNPRALLKRYPFEMSGGMLQRMMVALALLSRAPFIIADEPISALDVSIRAQVLNLLSELQKARGLTYLFIAHDLSVVRFICDRIAVIHKGQIVELAESEELFAHPFHPYTQALLSAIPQPDPIAERQKKLLVYDPSCHHYSQDNQPGWHEIRPNHFIQASQEELEQYQKQL